MKILSAETNLGSATSVSNAPVVRLFNSGSSNILVTRKDYSGTVVGSFMVLSGDVVYCEKYFTDTLEGSADVKATKIGYSSMMSFASSGGGGSSSPTYTHSVSASSVDEGGSFTTTITTTNVADGTNLYWELSGTNITSADFSSGALTGTASISSNSATFSHTVDEDNLTEGTETVTIKVYSDSGRNTQVGNTLTVTIADTSTTPVAWSNDGTTWSNLLSVPGDSFDISPTKAFDTTRQTAQQGDAARTAGNAPMCIFDLSGSNAQTVASSVYVQAITGYSHWIEITVDGSTYTQTPSNGLYTWNISGQLTKIRYQNDNPNGRSYLEGIKLDGTWMTDNTVD